MSPLETIRRWFDEVWNNSRREVITQLFAADGLVTGVGPEPARGPEGFLPVYDAWQTAFTDFEFTILQGFENGEWANARVRGDFTHRASGRCLSAEGMVMARVVDGLIVEAHNGFDFGAMLERAGIFPGGSLVGVLERRQVFLAPELQERNKQVIRELVRDVFNDKQFDRVSEFYCEDCEGFDPALTNPTRGSQAIREVLDNYEAGFPDYQYAIHDLIAEGDRVAFRFVITAEHSRPFRNIPPSGQTLTLHGNAILALENGKIRRIWQQWDNMGFAAQLGLIDLPETPLM